MRAPLGLLLAGAFAALAASSGPAAAQGFLSMDELKTLITGNTVHFKAVDSGRTGRVYYDAKGEMLVDRDEGATYSGLWSVGTNGLLCINTSGEICGKVRKNADGTYTHMIREVPGYEWPKITAGKSF